jgi:hypothetical protein
MENKSSADKELTKDAISTSAIRGNRGKFIVVLLYVFITLVSPLFYFTPYYKNYEKQVINLFVSKDKDADQFFRQYISLLHQKNINQAYALFSPKAQENIPSSSVEGFSASFFASTTNEMEVIGWHWNANTVIGEGTFKNYDVTYEVKNNDSAYPYVWVSILAQDSGNGLKISDTHAGQERIPYGQQNNFDFSSTLVIALLIPILVAHTALRYISKAKNPRWSILLILLLGSLYFKFSSQGFNVNIGLYGFTDGSSEYLLPIPLGVIYYYSARKRYEAPSMEAQNDSSAIS